jgi:cell division protein FtsW
MAPTKTASKKEKKSSDFSFAQKLFIFRNSDIVKAPRNANYILLLAIIAILNIIGVVMVLSASSVTAISDYGSPWFFFQRQLIWLALGATAFIVMSRIPYTVWQKYTKPIMIVSFILLFVVLIPGIGIEVSGSRRWLGFGMWRFQPSELAKFALVVFVADLLTRRASKLGSFKDVMVPIILTSMVMMLLVVAEPDFDSAAVLSFIVCSRDYYVRSSFTLYWENCCSICCSSCSCCAYRTV